jgi:hypothetical protein
MSRLLERVAGALGLGARAAVVEQTPPCVVFARIEERLMPLQRGLKYEEPLNEALVRAKLGRVTGGGSVQGTDGRIEWVSLDIQLVDAGRALQFTRRKLWELGAPVGSVLKYNFEDGVATVPIA